MRCRLKKIKHLWWRSPEMFPAQLGHLRGHGTSNTCRQLLVDVSVIHSFDAKTGIQRVVRNVLAQLHTEIPEGVVVRPVFATRKRGYSYARSDFLVHAENRVDASAPLVSVQRGDVFLGLDLSAHLLPRHERQLRLWKRAGVSVYLFVYDLLPLQHPEWFERRHVRNYRRWIGLLARRADGAICISQDVKLALYHWLRLRGFRRQESISLSSIRLSGSHREILESNRYRRMDGVHTPVPPGQYVLMVGTIEPRKAYQAALAAFEHMWRRHPENMLSLVIVGKPGWKTDQLQERLRTHPECNTRLFWFDAADDYQLAGLYVDCIGVMAASYGEGYGLPLVEAAQYGKPVLARDIPVFREIAGSAVTFFREDQPSFLAPAIEAWVSGIARDQAPPVERECYNWSDVAMSVLASLRLTPVEKPYCRIG